MKKTFLFVLVMLFASLLNAQDRVFDQYRDVSPRATHWQPVSYGTSSQTATIIGVIDFEGVEQMSNQLEVGIFYGDVCRGAVMANYIPALERYYVFLTVYGNNGEEDSFKIYDHATQKELDMTCGQTYTYHDDDIVGSIPVPYVISFIYNHFEINVTADPSTGGTVTGGGTYERDATVTLAAMANYGYTFTKWTKEGDQVSTVTPYVFTATVSTMGDYVAVFTPIPYEITVTANPAAGGTVSGGGTHDYGTSVTLTATPATGYHFVNWTKDGAPVSASTSYTFTVSGAATYVANFELNTYAINVSANPTAGGTVDGGGTFNHFATCTLTATPNTGYHFVNWTLEGVEVSTSATYSFEVSGAAAYVANFELNSYAITATANPAVGGTITGAGTYNHFETCNLEAIPATGYHFVNWTLEGVEVSTSATYSFEVSGPASYEAHFAINNYTITVTANPTAGGTVTGGGDYDHFTPCEITATPLTGYHFVNWTLEGVEVSTSAIYNFEVSGAAAYVANFELNSYEITAVADTVTGGTITGAGTYNHFENCTLTAAANTGYTFVNWTKDGVAVSTDLSISFMVEGAAAYVAHFSLNNYEITVTADPAVGGTVAGAGTYYHFSTCTLTATPSTGYHFVNWTKDGMEVSTSATYAFEVAGAGDYVAHFAINNYTITVTANPTTGGTVTGTGNYDHFTPCEITATPLTGYHFVNWTLEGVEVSTSATYSFEVSGAAAYVANFELNSYAITATANPAVGGTITGAGTYNHFATCNLEATPAIGYHFVNWTLEGVEVSTSATYSFEVSGPASYEAHFAINNYTITVTANPTVGGTVTGGGDYDHFTPCEITATPSTGYHFVNWTLEGVEVSTSAIYNFEVSGAAAYVANFELNSYEITAVADTVTGGTITGAGTYNHFETCTLTAAANTGYTFVNWTKDGVAVSTDLSISFMVEGAAAYVAHFSLNNYEITVTADPAVGGTVAGAGTYYHFSTCTLTATPSTGYHFVNWTKDGVEVSTSATYAFEVAGASDYVAHFALNSYGITATADPTEGGTINGAGTYNHFETCTLTASANTGYTFVNWTKDGIEVSTDMSISFMVEGAASYVAHFSLNSYEITATVDPAVGGTVAGTGTYYHFSTCTLTATPSTGYHFVNWTKEGVEVSTSAIYAFEVAGAGDYVAHFAINNYTITVTANPTAGGTVTGGGNYDHFTPCEITATPSTGYHFVNWTLEGVEVSTSAIYNFEVSGAAAYVANFELNSYAITATVDPAVGGTVNGTGTYNHFETCTLTAVPATGYHFVKWTKDGAEVSTSVTLEFEVNGPAAYVAIFAINNYAIAVTANPTAGGTVTGAGNYDHFATCEITATPSTGYHFVNWTLNGTEVSTSATYSFEVSGPAAYVANFELNSYAVTATADPTAGGTVTGAGTYNHFETCTLTAVANTGYTFVNWTKDGVTVSTDLSISFMVEGAAAYVAHFSLNNYEITVTADPAVGGTVSGAGTYDHFSTCTLTATPSTGYHFVNWTLNGTEVSTSATYSFEVSGPATYVANFELNSYVITATANPTAGGTVTGAGTYNHFETCTLTASANTGYTFVNWTKDGVAVSTDLSISFTVEGAASYVAHFNLNSYEITATVDPAVGGSVTGAGTYNHFETCTLTATPSTGYHFVNWTKEGVEVSTSATYAFEVAGAGDYVAHFAINNYTITVTANPTAGGTVTGAGNYDHFATCEITATPSTGYHFVNWTLNGTEVSTSATYSFEVSGPATYVANFELNSYAITATANPTAGGTVTGAGTYNHFETCTLTASANTGYTFVNWTKDGVAVSTDLSISFTVEGAAAYVANFVINNYVISVTANPTVGGTVTGGGNYDHFATCEITATPSTGYHFVNWTLNGAEVTTSATYSFEVSGPATYVANFELNSYVITATANPTAGGTVTGAGTYNHFETCTLTASANTGYTFVNWTKDGVAVSTDLSISFTVEGAAVYVAHFEINNYVISVSANPTAGGTVTGGGNYDHFATCEITATPSTGYHFVNWTLNGTEVSTSVTYSFVVSGPATYVANFELNSYVITATANPTAGGTVTGAGTYNHFETCTLTASANTGYTFVNWTKDGVAVSTDLSISFTVEGAASYVAHFNLNSYEIVASANPAEGGSVTGAGTYNHFETCTLTAVASTGYTFVNWTLEGAVVSTSATYSFEVSEAASYVANFELNSYAITVTANPAEGGTVTGDGTYNHFETCTLTATPSTGYHFVNWTLEGVVVSTSATYSFEVSGPAAYVANFELNSYEITATANPAVGGMITGAGTYNHFETCTLTATPSTGYHFVNWTLGGVVVSTSATYSFEVSEAASYVANFELNSYEITVTANPAEGGTVTGAGTYNHFETCTLTATPIETYIFINWTKDGVEVSTDPTYTFTVAEGGEYVANFALGYVDIVAYGFPFDFGTVSGAGPHLIGSMCTLTALPYEGFYFVKWSKGTEVVSTDAEYTFEVTEAATYRAHFARIQYTISAEANPEEAGTIVGTGNAFTNITVCQLIARANEGYRFVNWTKDGEVVSTDYIYEFAVTGSAHFVANFDRISYEITAEADPEEGGTVTGAGVYNHGETVTMTAVENPDFRFLNWTENDEVVSEEATFTFEVTQDRHLVAHFINTVGVGETEEILFTVYPNPASERLFVECDATVRQCDVYNITGSLVLSMKDCASKFEIGLADLSSGTYIIQLTTDQFIQTKRFVKQ